MNCCVVPARCEQACGNGCGPETVRYPSTLRLIDTDEDSVEGAGGEEQVWTHQCQVDRVCEGLAFTLVEGATIAEGGDLTISE